MAIKDIKKDIGNEIGQQWDKGLIALSAVNKILDYLEEREYKPVATDLTDEQVEKLKQMNIPNEDDIIPISEEQYTKMRELDRDASYFFNIKLLKQKGYIK